MLLVFDHPAEAGVGKACPVSERTGEREREREREREIERERERERERET